MPQPAIVDNKIPHSILMPYENGDIARVTLSVYKPPKGQNRPIDAYVVTECEGDFTGAARRAAEAVYNLAQKRLSRVRQMVIGLDVQGLSPGSVPVTGESCGLSFAIAIAGELFKKKQTVAATGVVSSSVNGKVDRVDGIASKLTAAAEIIPQQGRILYPEGNHNEIPESVFRLAREKRITLHPVTTIAEAIYAAYDIDVDDFKKNRLKFNRISAKTIILLIAAIVLSTLFLINTDLLKDSTQKKSFAIKKTEPEDLTNTIRAPSSPIKEIHPDIHSSNIIPPQQNSHDSEKTTGKNGLDESQANEKSGPPFIQTPPRPLYPDSGFE